MATTSFGRFKRDISEQPSPAHRQFSKDRLPSRAILPRSDVERMKQDLIHFSGRQC